MFDELDEGTQLLKVVNSPPAQATGDIGYEGLPSDTYLCFAGKGTQMMRGEIPYNATKPDCGSLTQPTIPAAHPTTTTTTPHEETLHVLQWDAAQALDGGGEIDFYELALEGVDGVRRTRDATTTTITVAAETLVEQTHAAGSTTYYWRVRAVNTLGNAGGWSLRQTIRL